MAPRRRHPIHAMPFDDEIANDLAAEYQSQPVGRRLQARRKAWARDALLAINGQRRLHAATVPATTKRLLWIYTWTTVGDAVMDLAPRVLVPAGIEVDLLIAPALAPLFTTDRRFRAVHGDIEACADVDYDFVLLDSLRTRSLRLKAARFASLPFATMRGHHAGERFDRAAFADRRLRQLFALPLGAVVAPRLDLGADTPPRPAGGACRIALAVGARVATKLYPRWGDVVAALIGGWPTTLPAPEFVLLGQGASAAAQRDEIGRAAPNACCVSRVDTGTLRDAAVEIASCHAFLGVDGGLMHVAVGVGTPGLALFTRIDPIYFLRPESTMTALATAGELDGLDADDVAAAFTAALPRFLSGR